MNPLAALQGISFGPQGSYQDLLSQEQLKAAKQQGLLGFGGAMLANSGWSTQRPSLGAALGQGVMAGSQMQQQAQQQALQMQMLKRQMKSEDAGKWVERRIGDQVVQGMVYPDGTFVPQGVGNHFQPREEKDQWRPATDIERRQANVPDGVVAQVNNRGEMRLHNPPVGRTEYDAPIGGNRRDAVTEQYDWLAYQAGEMDRMIGALEQDPNLAGLPGAIRRFGQTVTGSATDLASFFGSSGATEAASFIGRAEAAAEEEVNRGGMSQETFNELFRNPNISEMQLYENTLGYTLARLRQPDGRLLASVINQAVQDAKITGFKSSEDAINRQKAIRRELRSRMGDLERRLGKRPNNVGGGWSVEVIEE